MGISAAELTYDLMLERNGRELLYMPFGNYAEYNLDALREMLLDPVTDARPQRRRRALRTHLRRQHAVLHALALGARSQPRRADAGRDRGAAADQRHREVVRAAAIAASSRRE